MEKLDTLNLNNNKIEGLGPRYFEGMSRLTSLQLDYNKINLVDDEAFYGLEGRHRIGFLEYPIYFLPEQLQSMSLQSNKIDLFPTMALRPLHQLKTLHLNDNNISRYTIWTGL